ncbi:MAG: hypothetical protein C4K47_02720 [Candidatus Thorarchaeota archaeon]|nr:MAG: hypothetical protein C4K47_02720 [Candidatus Thorarchaeota archaeon]
MEEPYSTSIIGTERLFGIYTWFTRGAEPTTECSDESPAGEERSTRNDDFPSLVLLALAVLFTWFVLAPILYWLLVAPFILSLLGAQIHQPLNISRIALLLAVLALAAPSVCIYLNGMLTFFGAFGEFAVLLATGYVYVQSISQVVIIAYAFMVFPQLVFTGQLWRYYRGTTTRENTTLSGIICFASVCVLFALPYVLNGPSWFGVVIPLTLAPIIGAIVWRCYKGTSTRRAKTLFGIICLVSSCVLFATVYLLSIMPWFSVLIPLPLALIIGLFILWQFPPQHSPTK